MAGATEKEADQRWKKRLISDSVHGIHGLMKGDVDRDGKFDLLATSAQPTEPYPESLVWLAVPRIRMPLASGKRSPWRDTMPPD